MAGVQDVKVPNLMPCSDIATKEEKFVDMMSAVEEGRMGYYKADVGSRSEGHFVIRAPESLYSAIAFVPTLAVAPRGKRLGLLICIFLPLFSSGVMSAIAQIAATYYVMLMNIDNKDAFNKSNPNESICERDDVSSLLSLICLCVFTMTCLADVQVSFDFLNYINRVPNRIGDEEETELLNQNNASAISVKKSHTNQRNEEFMVETFGAGGFTKMERLWAYFWFLIKIGSELFVILAGGGFVLHSPDHETLILNAVALAFILDIDDAAYKYSITDMQKTALKSFPNFGLIMTENVVPAQMKFTTYQECKQFLGSYFQILALFGVCTVSWYANC
ncbi:hypothetical protein TrVE_jg10891 [Triparma verrucosa]|uniref:Uncharacterized protein n=1 Tax=Triparma verrucosa TaxID=1606542 RepID=A0A9W7EU12_9STRA|nr:hypothetical protein TrVE_jg10891 [Triparma verrucosa]